MSMPWSSPGGKGAAECAAWQAGFDAMGGAGWTYCSDKRADPWTMIGVAAVDLPMCELTEAAAAAGWTDDQADPSEVLTRQGCACADSYTYEGRTYTGCTTDDAPEPDEATLSEDEILRKHIARVCSDLANMLLRAEVGADDQPDEPERAEDYGEMD